MAKLSSSVSDTNKGEKGVLNGIEESDTVAKKIDLRANEDFLDLKSSINVTSFNGNQSPSLSLHFSESTRLSTKGETNLNLKDSIEFSPMMSNSKNKDEENNTSLSTFSTFY
ncbi:hypothetical protein K502DRAFT_341936 [Neoconidiobolus thromboides FSU 785]|nr:hypothetical protein K502DRAFT_341936 [Neoconidiobolus thromboides FSU 785]